MQKSLPFSLLIALGICAVSSSLPAADASSKVGPWDLSKLFKAPKFEWVNKTDAIRSLMYEGEPFQGKPTRVFAYYASPETVTGAVPMKPEKHPGIVLIHGGGGTAFPQWAELWATRGYVAISMDLSGCRPDVLDEKKKPTRMEDGGPDQGHPAKFETIATEDVTDDWPYHAVANGILAHSLLRSLPEVNAERTAVTGISWGGYTTCLVASIDHRFKAAVPVYGCGFLNENSAWLGEFAKLGPDKTARWVKLYDPSSYLPQCRVPLFFVNDTNDFAYPLDSYMKSFNAAPVVKNIRLDVTMKHGHESGWAPKEIGLFVDNILGVRGEKPLPVFMGQPVVKGEAASAKVQSAVPIKAANLVYALPGPPINKREWKTVPAIVLDGTVIAPAPPAESDMFFLDATDERDAKVSSGVVIRMEKH